MGSSCMTWVRRNAELIKICIAITAGIWTLFLYKCSVDNKRIEKTLAYSEQYNDGRVFEARAELNRFWMQKEQIELLNRYRKSEIKVEELQRKALKFIRTHIPDKN